VREGLALLSAGRIVDGDVGSPARGVEFFDDQSFDASVLRDRFADWWTYWEKQGYRPPSRIPSAISTTSVTSAGFVAGDVPWELRLAAIRLEDDQWASWPSMLPTTAP
jgi:hypothetical protein